MQDRNRENRMIFITWNYNGQEAAIRAFEELGCHVERVSIDETGNITDNAEFSERLSATIECDADPCRFVFSHDYFPVVSDVCETHGIPYLSVVYDSPHYTLTSKTVSNSVNNIYVFDRGLINELQQQGITNLRHAVLSADAAMAEKVKSYQSLPYEHEVSFVGSLYQGAYIFYDQIHDLPPALDEFLSTAMEAQKKIFGYDLFGDPKIVPDKILDALGAYAGFSLTGDYRMEPRSLLRDMLRKKVTSMERSDILARTAEKVPMDLYTTPGAAAPSGVRNLGYADYERQMPRIFNRSKINLNITLRTILTGIPQRALDIMACGGFLLSDHREELEEFFVPGEELATACSPEEFVEKTEWYLSHDDERERIARNGQKKALEQFSNVDTYKKMIIGF